MMTLAGFGNQGQSNGRAKLSNHEVKLIRQIHGEGMDVGTIAVKFEISRRTVYKLLSRERRA